MCGLNAGNHTIFDRCDRSSHVSHMINAETNNNIFKNASRFSRGQWVIWQDWTVTVNLSERDGTFSHHQISCLSGSLSRTTTTKTSTTFNSPTICYNTCVKDTACRHISHQYPGSKIHGANVGPTLGRQDPGRRHVGHVNLAIWVCLYAHRHRADLCGPFY